MNLLPSKSTVMNIVWVLGTLALINNVSALDPVKRIVSGSGNSFFN